MDFGMRSCEMNSEKDSLILNCLIIPSCYFLDLYAVFIPI
jgi:hypothetical protein